MESQRDKERRKACLEVMEILGEERFGLTFHEIYIKTTSHLEDVISTIVTMAEMGYLDNFIYNGIMFYRFKRDKNE